MVIYLHQKQGFNATNNLVCKKHILSTCLMRDARLLAVGELAPSDSQPTPTHSTEPEATLPPPRVSPYPYAFDQVIQDEDSVCSIQRHLLGCRVTSQAVAPSKPIGGAKIYKRTHLSYEHLLFPAHTKKYMGQLAFYSNSSAI